MRPLLTMMSALCALPVAAAGVAQTRLPIPAIVAAKMRALDARCVAAGGRIGAQRYVFAQDFNGDGLVDYLISEGDYACVGRLGLFRKDGEARIEILVTDRVNIARPAFAATVIGYRILDGRPPRVQVARRGASCGAGVAPDARCAAQLAWNGTAFVDEARVGAGQDTSPVAAGKVALGEAAYLADCRAALVKANPRASQWAAEECRTRWGKVVASGPVATAMLATLAPTPPATLAEARARMAGVQWLPRAKPPVLAEGRLGALSITVAGAGARPATIDASWTRRAADIPFDVVQAMRERGATMIETACEKTGVGAGTRTYAGTTTAGGRFSLQIEQQTAPLGSMDSYYTATLGLGGAHPARGARSDCDF